MKTTTAYFKLSVFSPMLFLSIVACAPVQNHGMPTGIRPVAPTSDTLATTDEVEYQGAVRAIYDRDYGRALDYLQAARNMQASDVRVLNAFGVVYDKLGRFDLSARYYTQALAADPHSAIVLKNVAYSRVLQGMVDGHTAAVMAAASPPVPAAQAPSNDLPLERTAIMAHAELAMDPQMLSGGASAMVALVPPTPVAQTADGLQIPDLAPIMAPAELALEPQMLPKRAPVMVAAMPPVPAVLIAGSIQVPDLAPIMAPVGLALEPQMVQSRAPVMVAPVPPAPATLLASGRQTPDLGPGRSPAQLALDPQMLPKRTPVTVAPMPPALVVPTAVSIQIPDMTPVLIPADLAPEPKMLPRRESVMVVAAAPQALAIPAPVGELPSDLPPLPGLAQTKSTLGVTPTLPMTQPIESRAAFNRPSLDADLDVARLDRSAGVSVPKSQSAIRSPREPEMAGRHLSVINATGQSGISERVRQQLLHLGWTAPLWAAVESGNQSGTTIRYARRDSFTAHALARTVPFPVQLALCVDPCNGIELIVGREYLTWKPKSSKARRWSSSAEFLTSNIQGSENDRQ